MSNRLISETSPYLRQHAENPVDWYPWGPDAFERARREDKPVFLSVGYSACHWCHVMERESFEDEATAALMNEHFVSVKVDREERPDVDAIYMDAVQAMNGSGGWPMSVFLTPDAVPFYGGTYFPDTGRYGMPSFTDVLTQISTLWTTRRDEVLEAGDALKEALDRKAVAAETHGRLDSETLEMATRALSLWFDWDDGGWSDAPKFPQPAVIEFVLRRFFATGDERLLRAATLTLDRMMRGGIYDQLGGGFHRYSTDKVWLVPHFEKMLYDNAQLARVYLHAWQITGTAEYRDVVTETLDYLAREMLDASGGFYSAQDADTEGHEGRYFVWTQEQVRDALGGSDALDADVDLFSLAYGVTPEGNFEGSSILTRHKTAAELAEGAGVSAEEVEARLGRMRRTLLDARQRRTRPGLDDKVLAGWNGLVLGAFAEAARVLSRDDYAAIAERSAGFLLSEMRTSRGRMRRTWKDGEARLNGYLEDYANVAEGLLEVYQTTFERRWFDAARELARSIVLHFADPDGGFFDTSDDHERLLVRPKTTQDGAMPSGGAVTADVLVRLSQYLGDQEFASRADAALASMQDLMARAPLGFARWLSALDLDLAPPEALGIIGEDPGGLLAAARATYRPNLLVAAAPTAEASRGIAMLEGREALDGFATAYLCRHFVCERPATTASELRDLLDGQSA